MKKNLEIIFEDEWLVAVNKPAGLLTIQDRFKHDLPNLYSMLIRDREEIYTLHRLDRNTSGGILFAKDKETHRLVSQLFMDRIPQKYYTAIVDGVPREKKGIINQPLSESMSTRGKMLVHQRGKESTTAYEVIEDFGRFSHINIKLHTGRLHQIRVHMAHIGHPLMVDSLYGKREEFFLSEVKGRKYKISKNQEENPLLTRQPLHASKLVLQHPHTNDELNLEFPIPKDIRAILNQFRKILG